MISTGSERDQLHELKRRRHLSLSLTHTAENACHVSVSGYLDCLVNSHPGGAACKIMSC